MSISKTEAATSATIPTKRLFILSHIPIIDELSSRVFVMSLDVIQSFLVSETQAKTFGTSYET